MELQERLLDHNWIGIGSELDQDWIRTKTQLSPDQNFCWSVSSSSQGPSALAIPPSVLGVWKLVAGFDPSMLPIWSCSDQSQTSTARDSQ